MTDNLIDRPLREILVVANGDPEKVIALLREQMIAPSRHRRTSDVPMENHSEITATVVWPMASRNETEPLSIVLVQQSRRQPCRPNIGPGRRARGRKARTRA
jgi:hypothetical protein